VVWLERVKIGEEPLNIPKIQRKGMEIAMFLPIAAQQFCLLSYWQMAFPSGFPIPFKNCP
jgi:hypothetical protein